MKSSGIFAFGLFFPLLTISPPMTVADVTENTLIEFRRAGAWDIRCVDQADNSGNVVCDLYLVINYMPHPNFRAMVMMIFLEGSDRPRIRLDYEAQTRLEQISDSVTASVLPLADCASPCVLTGADATQLVDMLHSASPTLFSITDYLVQSFEIPLDIDGFADGYQWLQRMQAKYR